MNIFRVLQGFVVLWITCMSGQTALSQPTEAATTGERTQGSAASPDASDLLDTAYVMASLSVGGVQLSPAIKQAMREQLLQEFAQDAAFQELEQEFPGVAVAVADAVVPVAARQTEETMPALITRLAALYAKEMTPDEIAVATEWYSSSAFSRVSAAMESNVDLSEIFQAGLADTEFEIRSEDLEAMEMNSAAKAVPGLGLEDKATLIRFSKTAAFAKIESLKPKTRTIETEWSNEDVPHHDAELDSVTTKALEAFTGMDLSE